MNIWLMNHYASGMYFNKAGRHYWFAKFLEAQGHKVTVFCESNVGSRLTVDMEGSQKSTLKTDGTTEFVFVKCPKSTGNGISRIRNMTTFFFRLKPVCREYAKVNGKPDIILASSVHPLTMVAGLQIAKKMHVPCICEVRDLWPEAIFAFGKTSADSLIGRILTAGEHWVYKTADAMIFTKEGDTDYLKEKGWTTAQGGDVDLAKCHYINNGVNVAAYTAQIGTDTLDDPDLTEEGKFNVVYAGTIRPVNNVGNLLDTAKLLAQKGGYEDVQFLVFGNGFELPKLKERVKNEGITNVKLKGAVEKKYIPYVLSRSSVNVLNYSQTEYNWTRGNSSNKLFEYMASGKPIISTVKMGYSIINKYTCGVELEECTPECLAKAVMEFHDMPREKYAAYGQNAAEGAKDFDFGILTEKLMAVIRSVLEQ